MHSLNFDQLGNDYFAMRHGQSEANVAGIIVSDPAVGLSAYGLSAAGRQQVVASANRFAQTNPFCERIQIVSSDFLRAKQTAELLAAVLECAGPITYTPQLRERYFGAYDGAGDSCYQQVWQLDAENAEQSEEGVESVASVRNRVAALIAELEHQCRDEQFVLVAHGDVLQIAQTLFAGLPGAQHRQVPHLQVAEIRRLN